MTRLALVLVLGSLGGPGALAQVYLFNAPGTPAVSYGVAVAFVGDVDGDLHEDYAVTAPLAGGTEVGRVSLRSGFTGEELATLLPPGAISLRFGRGVAGLGDVDGDFRGDIAVSDNFWTDTLDAKGRIALLSGRTGATLWTFVGPAVASSQSTGRHLDDVGDANGDGVHDLFVCGSSETNPELAQAYLLSGATGGVLRSWTGGRVGSRAGDANGDGVGDVAILRVVTTSTATLSVYSGATGGPLWTRTISALLTTDVNNYYAKSIAPAGDVNGDGHDDLAVGLAAGGFAVELRSGIDGAVLLRMTHPSSSLFGLALAPATDLDGDGRDDLLVAAKGTGLLELRSTASGVLLDSFVMGTPGADTEAFSLAFSPFSKRHVAYPLPATATPLGRMLAWDGGQLNSTRAALWVGTGTVPSCAGPHHATLVAGTPFILNWLGPPDAPLLLLAGPLRAHHAFYPGFGMADIGTPPAYADIAVLLDGTQGTFPGVFFRTGSNGSARQTFPTPALPPGVLAHLQGLVLQAAGAPTPVVLTAATTLEVF